MTTQTQDETNTEYFEKWARALDKSIAILREENPDARVKLVFSLEEAEELRRRMLELVDIVKTRTLQVEVMTTPNKGFTPEDNGYAGRYQGEEPILTPEFQFGVQPSKPWPRC